MKLLSVYTDLGFKQVFENGTDGRNSPCRLTVNSESCKLHLPLSVPVQGRVVWLVIYGSQDGVHN
jgi:hypothetical protein